MQLLKARVPVQTHSLAHSWGLGEASCAPSAPGPPREEAELGRMGAPAPRSQATCSRAGTVSLWHPRRLSPQRRRAEWRLLSDSAAAQYHLPTCPWDTGCVSWAGGCTPGAALNPSLPGPGAAPPTRPGAVASAVPSRARGPLNGQGGLCPDLWAALGGEHSRLGCGRSQPCAAVVQRWSSPVAPREGTAFVLTLQVTPATRCTPDHASCGPGALQALGGGRFFLFH